MSLTKASYSMITGAPTNVLDYGAKGDGTTDDTAAIQAAINSGASEVVFPAGKTYLVSPNSSYVTPEGGAGICINVPSNIRLVMYGATILQKSGTAGTGAIIGNSASTVTNVTIEGGIVNGNSNNTTGNMNGVVLFNSTNCQIKNVTIQSTRFIGVGFRAPAATTSVFFGENSITGCNVESTLYIGIQCNRQGLGLEIIGNYVAYTGDNAIDVEGNNTAGGNGFNQRVIVTGNNCYSCTTGVFLESSGNAIVQGNNIDTFNNAGIYLNQINTPAANVIINGNRITNGAGQTGIYVNNNSGYAIIESNYFNTLASSITANANAEYLTIGLNTHQNITGVLLQIGRSTNNLIFSYVGQQTYIGSTTNGVPYTATPITNSNNHSDRAYNCSVAPTFYLSNGSAASTLAGEYTRTSGTLASNSGWGAYAIYTGGITLISAAGSPAPSTAGDYILINGTLYYLKQFTGGGWQIQNLSFADGNYTSNVNGAYAWVEYYPAWQTN